MTHPDPSPCVEHVDSNMALPTGRADGLRPEPVPVSAVPALIPSAREAALVAAVRDVLSSLGQPTGYFPSIGAPLTHSLQRAFEAYEPHPAHKRHY